MKALITVCGLFAVFFMAIGCATSPKPADDETAEVTTLSAGRRMKLTVYGMSCPLCANNIDGRLKKVPGVEEVKIDLATGAVTLSIDEGAPPSRDDIERAVEETGFTLKALQTE